MTFDPIYLLYGVIFLGVILLVEGAYYFFADGFGGRRSANRRMRMLSAGTNAREVFKILRRSTPARWKKLGSLGAILNALNELITQSGLTISTGRMCSFMGGLSAVAFVAMFIVIVRSAAIGLGPSTMIIAGFLSIAAGLGGPILYLVYLKWRRLKSFAEQLPDALDMMVRSLRAGHPVSVAMGLTAQQMPDPIGTEFGIAVDEITYGLELREALANVGNRIDLQEFQYVVVAISIQYDTGGNLADVLGGLATVIRARFRMFKKIRALSAEGKFSAKILGMLPFVFGAMTFSAQPTYYLKVAVDPLFLQVAGLALVLQILGILIMHKMINFRV